MREEGTMRGNLLWLIALVVLAGCKKSVVLVVHQAPAGAQVYDTIIKHSSKTQDTIIKHVATAVPDSCPPKCPPFLQAIKIDTIPRP
jgi:hypothetical protein